MKRMRNVKVLIIALSFVMALSGALFAGEMEKIDINTATVKELVQLKRVGPKFAQRIVDFREMYGPFKQAEDILKVKGIGQKTWEANKEIITAL